MVYTSIYFTGMGNIDLVDTVLRLHFGLFTRPRHSQHPITITVAIGPPFHTHAGVLTMMYVAKKLR